ncbi:elongation factor G, partial [Paragonimus westermani]
LKFKCLLQSSINTGAPGLYHVIELQSHLAEAFLHRGPHRFGPSRLLSTRTDSRPVHQPVSSVHVDEGLTSKLIRNVGVIAHIDAGKTTTTERMLYLARRTHSLGEVDRGDTVTDYLPEERERGISIISAAACLTWKQHTLHLIDTPGHVDFTMEVERSLSVLDGALVILDGTEGVQAQTRTVWHQADRYNLPRLVFVNKMDRDAADLNRSLASLSSQLASSTRYVPIQWPVFDTCLSLSRQKADRVGKITKSHKNRPRFIGLVDLTTMELKDWSTCVSPDDTPNITGVLRSDRQSDLRLLPNSMRIVLEARMRLMCQLAEVDDEFAERFLGLDDAEVLLPADVVQATLKRATHSGKVVPVLLGSSRQSIGIQPLLNAIVDYLPDPTQRPFPTPVCQLIQWIKSYPSHKPSTHSIAGHPNNCVNADPSVLLVFKICFDPHRGPLSLVRVYSGSVRRDCLLTNWSHHQPSPAAEKVQAVLQLTGEHHELVDSAGPGSIVALTGLESTRSGDLLGSPVSSRSKFSSDESDDSHIWSDESVSLFPELTKCEPVVYAAIEPASLSSIRNLEYAVACMQREDPSFVAKLDEETGQWSVGGMGDLHLEVIHSRLQREYKVDARLGSLVIAYKECPMVNPSTQVIGFGRFVGTVDGTKKGFLASVSIQPSDQIKPQIHFQRTWLHSRDSGPSDAIRTGRVQNSVRQACLAALDVGGPLLRSPVARVSVCVHRLAIGRPDCIPDCPLSLSDLDELPSLTKLPSSQVASAAILALTRSAVTTAVMDAISRLPNWRLMEPMMVVELRLPANTGGKVDSLSQFLGDLSSRRAEIVAVDTTEEVSSNSGYHIIRALAPLAELVGYSATVRSMSSGRANLHLRLTEYRPVSVEYQTSLLSRLRWSPSAQT